MVEPLSFCFKVLPAKLSGVRKIRYYTAVFSIIFFSQGGYKHFYLLLAVGQGFCSLVYQSPGRGLVEHTAVALPHCYRSDLPSGIKKKCVFDDN